MNDPFCELFLVLGTTFLTKTSGNPRLHPRVFFQSSFVTEFKYGPTKQRTDRRPADRATTTKLTLKKTLSFVYIYYNPTGYCITDCLMKTRKAGPSRATYLVLVMATDSASTDRQQLAVRQTSHYAAQHTWRA